MGVVHGVGVVFGGVLLVVNMVVTSDEEALLNLSRESEERSRFPLWTKGNVGWIRGGMGGAKTEVGGD